jgi:hypothetical protein
VLLREQEAPVVVLVEHRSSSLAQSMGFSRQIDAGFKSARTLFLARIRQLLMLRGFRLLAILPLTSFRSRSSP